MTCLLAAYICISAMSANPCTNGSFEQLGADSFPADWSALNQVDVVEDAHSGTRALRLFRPADDPNPETGLNRSWEPRSGMQGAMLDRVKGGLECWYKALGATNENLFIMVIPMDGTAFETGPSRTVYTVPAHHVGDGQWRRVRIKYDYSAYPEVKWVHFAARILYGAGEMLLDDMAYIEEVGPCVEVNGIRIEESANEPGSLCTVHATVENRGDRAAQGLSLRFDAPDGFQVAPEELALGTLAPDVRQRVLWTVSGARNSPVSFAVRVLGGIEERVVPIDCEPALEVVNYGPVVPVARFGDEALFECWLRNDGQCTVKSPVVDFVFEDGTEQVVVRDLAPGGSAIVSARSKSGVLQRLIVHAPDIESLELPGIAQARIQDTRAPAPSGRLYSAVSPRCAVLENEWIRLLFHSGEAGMAALEIQGRSGVDWKTLGWMPRLSRVVFLDTAAARQQVDVSAAPPSQKTAVSTRSLEFDSSFIDAAGAQWRVSTTFALEEGARHADITYQVTCTENRGLLRFDGPMVYALNREEAVFPGLEWLVNDEISSSTLDIEAGHPHQVRYVPHPLMVTIPAMGIHGRDGAIGLLWDANQRWDGERRMPSPVFASPDRFENHRAHLMGLQLPTVPDFLDMNVREAARPYPLIAGKPLWLQCQLFVDGAAIDALAAIDEWFRIYSFPEPSPMPRGSLENEVQFSMRAYLDSLWQEETKEWWTTKNGPRQLAYLDRPKGHVADLLLGAQLSPDAAVRDACKARAEEAAALMHIPLQRELLLQNGNTDFGARGASHISNLLAARDERGFWVFDADREDQGIFKGFDYHTLGADNSVAGGTCAENARTVLRYARVMGEWPAFNAVRGVLEFMASEKVPRAAQVWEVPFHAPDILAAAQAVDVFLEAYRFTGDAVWLDAAVYWARRGLPFVYFWSDPERPFLAGASIPVYGASLMKYSWFGRPVQWNGLCYAESLVALSEHDDSYPWRRVAELVVNSALHQQADEGGDVALWPDSIGAIDRDKSAWVFPPRQILRALLKLAGSDEDARTAFIGGGHERIAITSAGEISEANLAQDKLCFSVNYRPGDIGRVVVANIARPAVVSINGVVLGARDQPSDAALAGWYYDDLNGFLSILVADDGRSEIVIEGTQFRAMERLSEQVTDLFFEFESDADGWHALHDVEELTVRNGTLTGRVSGPDPFIGRGMLRIDGARYRGVEIRMRVSGGVTAQLYWSTADAPGFNEERVRVFDILPGSDYRTYRISMRGEGGWENAVITGLRLDPINGVSDGEFAVAYVRGYGEGPGAGGIFRMSQ